MRYLDNRASAMVDRVIAAKTDNFTDLVAASGLSPARDFKHGYLRAIDFGGSDLNAYDFSGTVFDECCFVNSRFGNACLAKVSFQNCDPSAADDWYRVADGFTFQRGRLGSNRHGIGSRGPIAREADIFEAHAERPLVTAPAWLLTDHRHPVFVFGATGSGKTVFIESFVDTLQTAFGSDMDVSTGASNSEAMDWISRSELNSAPELAFRSRSITLEQPPLVAVDLLPRGFRIPIRLALFECEQELPSSAEGLRTSIVSDILANYPESISVVFLTPWRDPTRRGDEDRSWEDEQLVSQIMSYRRRRPAAFQGKDRHLVLLNRPTKPDAFSSAEFPLGEPRSPRTLKLQFKNVLPEAWLHLQEMGFETVAVMDYLPTWRRRLLDTMYSPYDLIKWLTKMAIRQSNASRATRRAMAHAFDAASMNFLKSLAERPKP